MKTELMKVLIDLLTALKVDSEIIGDGISDYKCLDANTLLSVIGEIANSADMATPFTYVSIIHAHVRLEGDSLMRAIYEANNFARGM